MAFSIWCERVYTSTYLRSTVFTCCIEVVKSGKNQQEEVPHHQQFPYIRRLCGWFVEKLCSKQHAASFAWYGFVCPLQGHGGMSMYTHKEARLGARPYGVLFPPALDAPFLRRTHSPIYPSLCYRSLPARVWSVRNVIFPNRSWPHRYVFWRTMSYPQGASAQQPVQPT